MNETIGTEYVPRELFDVQLQNINERATFERSRTDDKIEKLQAIMEKNFELLNTKLDKVEDTLSISIMGTHDRIDGLEKRFNDMKEHQNKWFTVFGILFSVAAIVAPIAVAIIQRVWK